VGTDARGDVFIVAIPTSLSAPTITSANNATFTETIAGNFSVNAIGNPIPSFTQAGGTGLPSGVTFTDNGNGTATIGGTPTASGVFTFTITATNSQGSTNQPFTLTVNPASTTFPPTITTPNSATFVVNVLSSFSVLTTGTPTPSLSESGTLPAGVTFTDEGNGTALITGTPTGPGTFPFTITASNGISPNAVQPFTLTVGQFQNSVVTGTFIYPNGSPVASGLYQWQLSSDAVEISTVAMVPMVIPGTLDANGNMIQQLVFNDQLQTAFGASTTYQLTVKDSGGRQVWNGTYYLTGTAANLNLIPPQGS
jgi:hypothetical protein